MKKKSYLYTGILISCLLMLPFLILGTKSVVAYHDQLDGTLMMYILRAKYLFTGVDSFPEFMNGLPANGAVPPSPAFVLLYRLFTPFVAFMLSQWIIFVVGFVGMFLLSTSLLKDRHLFCCFALSVIFMLLPFYPVYGLNIPAQPLFFYAILRFNTEISSLKDRLLNDAIIFMFGLCTSFVLVGFAVLFALFLICLYQLFHKRTRFAIETILADGLLFISYAITNFSLFLQVISPSNSFVSHKVEMLLYPSSVPKTFFEILIDGDMYIQSFPLYLIIFTVFLLLYLFLNKKRPPAVFRILLPLPFLLSACFALYHSSLITSIVNSSDGFFSSFNPDRVCWMLPTVFFVIAAFALDTWLNETSSVRNKWLRYLPVALLFVLWGLTVLWHSNIKPNVARIVKGEPYHALDWNGFFAPDTYNEIKEAIGRDQESYRIVSIGMFPDSAAYNGFYCLDFYSNNYPLEYKHAFREIIAPELEKDDWLRGYYDTWGSRVYIATSEAPNSFTTSKEWNITIHKLELNIQKLREMGGEYILSAPYIENASELGLELIREEPFGPADGWCQIYVYRIL